VLHPVGPLRPVVYWRRRLVLLVLLAGLGAGGWVGAELGTGRMRPPWSPAASSSSPSPVAAPALAQVAFSGTGSGPAGATAASSAAVVPAASTAGPLECSDDMLTLVIHAPASVPAGSVATFQLVVTDIDPAPCARSLATDQELALADAAGDRIWSSADCGAAAGPDVRTLTPGQPVVLSLTWDGRTSAPACAGERTAPPAGSYFLQGRLATKTTQQLPIAIG